MKSIFGVITVLFLLIAGCHGLQNLTVNDIKKEKNFYKTHTFEKSFNQIQNSLYTYSTNCRPLEIFSIDPNNPKKAQMVFETGGFTKMSVMVVLDFKVIKEDSTFMKSYSYYSTWRNRVDRVINAIESPKSCQ